MIIPFIYPRTVSFGDCDASGVFFTPRALDYAVEAVEVWFEAVLGTSWGNLIRNRGLESRVITVDGEYRWPLAAGQVVQVRLAVEKVDQCSFLIAAVGDSGGQRAAQPNFTFRLAVAFINMADGNQVPIPEHFMLPIQSYRKQCGGKMFVASEPGSSPAKVSTATPVLPLTVIPGEVPFVRQRRVRYGECGIAGNIYGPKLLEIAVEMVGEWYSSCLGVSWLEQCSCKRGVPFLRVQYDYLQPLEPGDTITMVVIIARLGRSSIGYEVTGYANNGLPCFEAQLAACYVEEEAGVPKSAPFPENMRSKILTYQQACVVLLKAV